MIRINGRFFKPEALFKEITKPVQRKIIQQMADYPVIYDYNSVSLLKFELLVRENTLKAAEDLNKSGAKFTTFTYAFCNKKYWNRLSNGAFLLKEGEVPSNAITDIIKNGSLYAFECATGKVIVMYLAVLNSIGTRAFNHYFRRLYLYSWHFDEDLPMSQKIGDDYLIGDILHFNNPDFDPKQPWWRAENVIYFGNDKFYGHGVGITNSSSIINFLNKKRRQKADDSAYLMRMITRPHYKSIYILR